MFRYSVSERAIFFSVIKMVVHSTLLAHLFQRYIKVLLREAPYIICFRREARLVLLEFEDRKLPPDERNIRI